MAALLPCHQIRPLLEALANSSPQASASPADLVAHIPALYAAFDRDDRLVRAMVHDPHGRRVRIDNAEARRAKFRDALQPVLAGLGEDDSIGLLASISAICSASGWEMMKDNWQLDRAAAARAAQSGVEALIDAARHKTDLAADAAVGVTTKGDRG